MIDKKENMFNVFTTLAISAVISGIIADVLKGVGRVDIRIDLSVYSLDDRAEHWKEIVEQLISEEIEEMQDENI